MIYLRYRRRQIEYRDILKSNRACDYLLRTAVDGPSDWRKQWQKYSTHLGTEDIRIVEGRLGGGLADDLDAFSKARVECGNMVRGPYDDVFHAAFSHLGFWKSAPPTEAEAGKPGLYRGQNDTTNSIYPSVFQSFREGTIASRAGRAAAAARLVAEELRLNTWSNKKHAEQWISRLENHIFPTLGLRPIGGISGRELLSLLQALNIEHHETAKRIRQRPEAVWADAVVANLADNYPPATLIRHLKGPAVKSHFRSLDYKRVPAFVRQLRDSDAGLAVRLGFESLILACARAVEIRRAQWSGMNRVDRIWRIPGELMKSGEPHDVYLTDRMLEILDAVEPLSGGKGIVFPGHSEPGLSDDAFLAVLRRMKRNQETTVHGLRASFDTWASETTRFRAAIIETALAHEETNAVRAAYNRAEYWEQRIALAKQWTDFVTCGLDQHPSTVRVAAKFGVPRQAESYSTDTTKLAA